jgi:hypothetical protein
MIFAKFYSTNLDWRNCQIEMKIEFCFLCLDQCCKSKALLSIKRNASFRSFANEHASPRDQRSKYLPYSL